MDKQLVLYTGPPSWLRGIQSQSTDPQRPMDGQRRNMIINNPMFYRLPYECRRPVNMERQLVLYTGPPSGTSTELTLYTGPPPGTCTDLVLYTGPPPRMSDALVKYTGPRRPMGMGSQRNPRAIMNNPKFYRLPYECRRCGATTILGKHDRIICDRCEGIILYKPRTDRIVWHDGR